MSGSRAEQPWPGWLAVAIGALSVPVAVSFLAAPGLATAWAVLAGSPRADIARVMVAWLAVSGVLGFAVGGWMTVRLAGAGNGRAVWLAVASGVGTLGLVAAVLLVGLNGTVNLRPAAVALGFIQPTLAVPEGIPAWAEVTNVTIRPSEVARERTLTTIGYLVSGAALSLGAAALGGKMAGGDPAGNLERSGGG